MFRQSLKHPKHWLRFNDNVAVHHICYLLISKCAHQSRPNFQVPAISCKTFNTGSCMHVFSSTFYSPLTTICCSSPQCINDKINYRSRNNKKKYPNEETDSECEFVIVLIHMWDRCSVGLTVAKGGDLSFEVGEALVERVIFFSVYYCNVCELIASHFLLFKIPTLPCNFLSS